MKGKKICLLFSCLAIVSLCLVQNSFAFSERDGVITLKYSRWSPAASGPAKIDQQWATKLEEKTQGRVKVKCFFDGSLAKMLENYRACQTGIADIAYYVIGINPGLTELNKVVNLPFMGMNDMSSGSKAYKELLQTIPALQEEFQGMQAFRPRMMPAYQMHFTKNDVRVPQDLKGMKIMADSMWSVVLNGIGAAPVKLPVGDWYMSLERNLVEGHIVHYPAIYIYKTLDILKHHTLFGDGGCAMAAEVLLFNQRSWNKIPSDLQQIIAASLEERFQEHLTSDKALIDKAVQEARKNNHVFTYVTGEEIDAWRKAVKPVHEKWIEDNAQGPSQMIFDKALEVIEKYNNGK